MSEDVYDMIVVGGGHNGLTCGVYLAQAGKKVSQLEARSSLIKDLVSFSSFSLL